MRVVHESAWKPGRYLSSGADVEMSNGSWYRERMYVSNDGFVSIYHESGGLATFDFIHNGRCYRRSYRGAVMSDRQLSIYANRLIRDVLAGRFEAS